MDFDELYEWALAYKHYNTKKGKGAISEIIPGLFVGNKDHAQDIKILQRLKIRHILNVGGGRCFYPNDIVYLKVGVLDSNNADLKSHFKNTNKFIRTAIESKEPILVHCRGGFSRSPAIVMAYLVDQYSVSFEKSLELCRINRPICNPRNNFIKQIQQYQSDK